MLGVASSQTIGLLMAEEGVFFDGAVTVRSSREEVTHAIMSYATGEPHSRVTVHDSGAITVTRRYRPDWAIALAILSVVLFSVTLWTVGHPVAFWLIGLLAVFYKKTEMLWISVTPDGDQTRLIRCGTASEDMLSRLFLATASMDLVGAEPLSP